MKESAAISLPALADKLDWQKIFINSDIIFMFRLGLSKDGPSAGTMATR
jgi:hypothetical protein